MRKRRLSCCIYSKIKRDKSFILSVSPTDMKTLKHFATGKLDPKTKKDWKLDETKDKEDGKTTKKEKGQYAKTKDSN